MFLFPPLMTFHEQGFDRFSVTASLQRFVAFSEGYVRCTIYVCMCLKTAYLTVERPLVGSILAACVVTSAALLGRIRTIDRSSEHSSFFCIPLC